MATYYIKIIKAQQKTGPYFIAGWSFGGVVAYEMAQQLFLHGERVENLILIDSVNPRSQEFLKMDIEKTKKDVLSNENNNISYFLNEEMTALFEYNLKTSLELMKKYKPIKYASTGNVTLLMAEKQLVQESEDYGWRGIIPNLIIRKTPGSHATLFDVNFAESTAKNIVSSYFSQEKPELHLIQLTA